MARNGQWMKVDGQLAIHIGRNAYHLINADGTTQCDMNGKAVVVTGGTVIPVTDVADLPASRRSHLPPGFNPATQRVGA